MLTRRSLLACAAAFAALPTLAHAFEIEAYDPVRAQAAIAAGKRVVVHVYADWCSQCHAQKAILEGLEKAGTYDSIAFFRVDFDAQQDVVAKLKCPRSTLIAYKGGKEVKRDSFGVTRESVEDVLNAAL